MYNFISRDIGLDEALGIKKTKQSLQRKSQKRSQRRSALNLHWLQEVRLYASL